MIYNDFLACDVCKTIINLRVQMGFYDIPVHARCPECETKLDGIVKLNPYEAKISNTHSISISIEEEEFYSLELSVELPTRKIKLKKISDFELSPFLRNGNFYDNSEIAYKLTSESMVYANFLANGSWDIIKQNFGLLINKKFDLLFPKLEKAAEAISFIPIKHVKNELDATIVNHQLLITTSGVPTVLGNDSLMAYMKISQKIANSPDKLQQLLEFITTQKTKFDILENKIVSLIDIFSKIYEQLIPVVSLRNANVLNKVDRNKYGITTASFEDLSGFYAKSYEWILSNIDLIVALNNIFMRNDYNLCVNGKKISAFLKLSKGSKLNQDYLDKEEPFSRPIYSLHNRLRNSIQHFDYKINYQTQEIIFYDRNKSEKTTLLDFANLCVENFSIIFYLLEIIYNLKKVALLNTGLIPSISN